MRILVTGSAGFIGFHLSRRLIEEGHEVAGVDGFTPYYDPVLKRRRQQILLESPAFRGHEILLEDFAAMERVYGSGFDAVYHFAAQAGVRYSLENPRAYLDANLCGTFNLLELMRRSPPRHALMASTSSVYGANAKIPFRETDRADHPLTFYAASKKANEEMAHSYSHLFGIPVTMLRFFTVYGPFGRPDMALFKFAAALFAGKPVDIYNHGNMKRDFTYVGDLVEAMIRLLDVAPSTPNVRTAPPRDFDSLSPVAPWRVVNIGAERPIALMDFVAAIEAATGLKADCNFMEMQQGDVPLTFADTQLLAFLTGFSPQTSIADGVRAFVEWYRDYYKIEDT
ncbi:NAD-dependent epimerase/dehydratase family protein [Methylocapsa palsarum]|uniref:UDP-glucuronate 4-epimerase n=1 Tax=Methylocapsa palsarum TaxID=1612308 RepID=A0A1I4A7A8_9HYPH|nr:NAD-dependent epimerase/dehydratase family protein [Methylocapsa palsarum]SFK51821.1 UDP-glucuronate 4-epimerase [Methylocapsa palsarum]